LSDVYVLLVYKNSWALEFLISLGTAQVDLFAGSLSPAPTASTQVGSFINSVLISFQLFAMPCEDGDAGQQFTFSEGLIKNRAGLCVDSRCGGKVEISNRSNPINISSQPAEFFVLLRQTGMLLLTYAPVILIIRFLAVLIAQL
jgi:hypothetical protein